MALQKVFQARVFVVANARLITVRCSTSWAPRGAGGGAGAGGALDAQDGSAAGEAFEARQHEGERAHVGGLFLHPDEFARVGVAVHFGGEFRFRERIKLLEKNDRGCSVLPALSLGDRVRGRFFRCRAARAWRRAISGVGNHRSKSPGCQSPRAGTTPRDCAACFSA